MSDLPPHLLAAIGRYHAEPEVWRLVRQLELYGVEVAVVRLQLGNQRAEGFGQLSTIYQTPKQERRNYMLSPRGRQSIDV